jgi:hypothetical protein
MTSLETSKAKWRAHLAQFRAEGAITFARTTAERWCLDPYEQSIKEKAFRQTMKCTLECCDICAEGMMNYDYEREFKRIWEGFEKVMVLVGENDAAVGPPDMLL